MTKELIQAYTARITQASKTELVVITYEILLSDIKEAQTAFEIGDNSQYSKVLKHASTVINELMRSLDYQYEISYNLMSLYIYASKCLIEANYQKNIGLLENAAIVIQKLMAGFEEICSQDMSGPVMQNAQQLYAGLTYGKGTLNEVYIDPQEHNRGFKA